jgi:response regulator RpfG family c-di-GMP phosphodiesterase
MSTFQINLHEAIYSLSDALDLVGVTHIHHGKHVAYMAAECGRSLGWQGKRMDDLFQAAMLHDCGVSRTLVHQRLTQFEWEKDNDHCVIGADLLETCPLMAHLAPIVRYHHTHWTVLQDMDLPLDVKLSANCIYMVDRVDCLAQGFMASQPDLLRARDAVHAKILDKRGEWFCPDLVDAFLEVSRPELFWRTLQTDHVHRHASRWLSETTPQPMDFEELRSIVAIFSHVVDAKSTFTREHSDGVARLARYLGELFQLSQARCEMLELAGLLHDLGKLRQPDELLNKPGRVWRRSRSGPQSTMSARTAPGTPTTMGRAVSPLRHASWQCPMSSRRWRRGARTAIR